MQEKKYKKYTKVRGIREVKTEQRKFNLTNLKRRKVETLLSFKTVQKFYQNFGQIETKLKFDFEPND
jgi:hypothetical protein